MKIDNIEFKFGADPEIFIRSKATGELVSAHNLIQGTKEHPLKVRSGAVQVDGMALEFNINPVDDFKNFNNNIDTVMNILQMMVPKHEFVIEPVAHFGKKYIESQPEDAKRLGCEPDYNAYTKQPNPRPDAEQPFRTASGHIHISWKKSGDKDWPDQIDPLDPTHFEACCWLVKALDKYVGIPSLLWDKDNDRRKLYGKAGSFRPKCYGNGWFGVEYRTISNKWLTKPEYRATVFNNTIDAIKSLKNNPDMVNEGVYGNNPENGNYESVSIQKIIDNADQKEYREFISVVCRDEVKSPRYYRELLEKAAA